MKRIISSLLIVFILTTISLGECTYAKEINSTNNSYSTFAAKYSKYDFSSKQNTKKAFKELINSKSVTKNENINGISVKTYNKNSFASLLNDCAKVNYVQEVNNLVYISYETNTGSSVIVSYNKTGNLVNRVVYDSTTDTAVLTDENKQTYQVFDNFKSDLNKSVSLSSTNENLVSDSVVSRSSSSIVDTFRHPTNDFPTYTKRVVNNARKYAGAPIYDYVKLRVKETMSDYSKILLDPKVFAGTTAITLIAGWLGGSMPTLVAILTAAGVLISGYDYISSAVKLYRSAKYQFLAAREGYAYDPYYRTDLLVYPNISYGELAGGYDNTGHWRWIISDYPSSWDKSNTWIANKAFDLYYMDVCLYGRCVSYYPD